MVSEASLPFRPVCFPALCCARAGVVQGPSESQEREVPHWIALASGLCLLLSLAWGCLVEVGSFWDVPVL